jgi:hypothetical protein
MALGGVALILAAGFVHGALRPVLWLAAIAIRQRLRVSHNRHEVDAVLARRGVADPSLGDPA